MIDPILYRKRIGVFTPCHIHPTHTRHKNTHAPNLTPSLFERNHNHPFITISYSLLMLYIITITLAMVSTVNSTGDSNKTILSVGTVYHSLPSMFAPLIFLLTVIISRIRPPNHSAHSSINLRQFLRLIYIQIRYNYPAKASLPYKAFRKYLVWLSAMNLISLTLCNMSGLVNPGPAGLTVAYQNVQGLIPFSELGNINPSLNQTKMSELQSFAYSTSPDIIVLNETWLKSTIHDNEILSPQAYKIFRCDRSSKTHPLDNIHSSKFF